MHKLGMTNMQCEQGQLHVCHRTQKMECTILRTPQELIAFRKAIPNSKRVGLIPISCNPGDEEARMLNNARAAEVDVAIMSVYSLKMAETREDLDAALRCAKEWSSGLSKFEKPATGALFIPQKHEDVYPGEFGVQVFIEGKKDGEQKPPSAEVNTETIFVKILAATRPAVLFLSPTTANSNVYQKLVADIFQGTAIVAIDAE